MTHIRIVNTETLNLAKRYIGFKTKPSETKHCLKAVSRVGQEPGFLSHGKFLVLKIVSFSIGMKN